jgi:hypothetical protein
LLDRVEGIGLGPLLTPPGSRLLLWELTLSSNVFALAR